MDLRTKILLEQRKQHTKSNHNRCNHGSWISLDDQPGNQRNKMDPQTMKAEKRFQRFSQYIVIDQEKDELIWQPLKKTTRAPTETERELKK